MPNATARAKARTLPEATKPQQRINAAADSVLRLDASQSFANAYHNWLNAKAGIEDPSIEEEEQPGRFKAEAEAERALFSTPAAFPGQVWQKLEAFEIVLSAEIVSGPRTDSVLMFALGSIKSDILNLDLCEGVR